MYEVTLGADGEIIAVGGIEKDVAVVRLLPDGAPDENFAPDGLNTYDFGGIESAVALKLYPDGKILAAGTQMSLEIPISS